MRLKVCFILISCLLLTLGFSCEGFWLPSDPNNINNATENARRADREIILQIEEMPKETFLKFIEESADLDDDEKQVVKKEIHPKVYTHVQLVKYKRNGETFLEINEFYPRKVIGQDAEGHQLDTGGSGSISIYRLENNSY